MNLVYKSNTCEFIEMETACHVFRESSEASENGSARMQRKPWEQAIRRALSRAFHVLDRDKQAEAIRRMAAVGYGERTLAHASGLTVEMVRRILAEPRP